MTIKQKLGGVAFMLVAAAVIGIPVKMMTLDKRTLRRAQEARYAKIRDSPRMQAMQLSLIPMNKAVPRPQLERWLLEALGDTVSLVYSGYRFEPGDAGIVFQFEEDTTLTGHWRRTQ